MDDLLGEDWQSSKPIGTPPLNPNTANSNYSSFRASPAPSVSATPLTPNLSRPSSTLNGGAKPPAGDQFGNLLSLKSQKSSGSGISMQERQRQLLEERKRQQSLQSQLWDKLGNERAASGTRGPPKQETEEDILAAFDKSAPVDNASYYPPPPPSLPLSGRSTPADAITQLTIAPLVSAGGFDDDDDTFGLLTQKPGNGLAKTSVHDPVNEDDILGDLSRPVGELPKRREQSPVPDLDHNVVSASSVASKRSPQDRSLVELVDMGFPTDTAKIALAETNGDVQAAVSWLLQQAHEEAKQKAQQARGQDPGRVRTPQATSRSPQRRPRGDQDAVPSWMREGSRPSGSGERDATQVAQEFGSKFLKGANSLWKASQKQMAKTMADFQQERDPSQPKWMQDSSGDSSRSGSQMRPVEKPVVREANITNEAALLDMPRDRPQKPHRPSSAQPAIEPSSRGRTPVQPVPLRPAAQSPFMDRAASAQDKRPATKLTRQEVEDQSAQAYISPARRKRPTPKPEPPPEPAVDLFSPAPVTASPALPRVAQSAPPRPTQPPASRAAATPTPKPKAPPRNIPTVSSFALSTSASHRKAGGEAFKRGDYASAHESYTAALSPLPAGHPITIVVLSNRCLTALKTGDAKTAVSDADKALAVIGVGLGVGETIDLGAGEGTKDMRDFYGKALTRKAEALEHLERWSDAASVWRLAIEAGVGGAVSLRGRDRCDKAAAPKPPVAARVAPVRAPIPTGRCAPPAKGLSDRVRRPTLTNVASADAVRKLRAANAAAEKADDEKFALTDQVDARLTAWKGGKADNLRALLQSLDNVLWESAGWKKVGMSDLVMANKVKIIYMKAIAKVHPDKIPQDATTEQRMISAAVFSTLNEAWDKFKKENNL